jgi:hypothetical protein
MILSENILLYSSVPYEDAYQIQFLVERAVQTESIILVRNIDQLYRTLRKPMNGIIAAMIMVGSDEELVDLVNLKDILVGIPMVLILPDQNKEAVTRGHALRPRYLTYADADLSVVPGIFKKIVSQRTKHE